MTRPFNVDIYSYGNLHRKRCPTHSDRGGAVGFDRGDKFAAYRTLGSLREYVLVDIPARRVEVFRRQADGDWLFHEFLSGCGDCEFPALGVSIPFAEVFENAAPPDSGPVIEEGET